MLWLRLLSDGARLKVEVWDQLPGSPVPRAARDDDESGRGLELVQALSVDWGWDELPGRDVKRVWALLASK